MNERTESKTKTVTSVRAGILPKSALYVLGVFVLICVFVVILVYVFSPIPQQRSAIPQDEPVLLPPQEIAAKVCAYYLMGRIEEALSFSLDWPDKDKLIDALKRGREHYEQLEYKLGPVEIRENETFDEATRVVVPNLSMKLKNLSTGKIIIVPNQEGGKIADTILEKRETAEGPRWYIVEPGVQRYDEIESTWSNLPRKKLADSPIIILKKGIIIQTVSDDKVVSERIVFWDEPVNSAVAQEKHLLLAPHEITVETVTCTLMDRIEESFSFYADWPAVGKRPDKERAIEVSKKIRQRFRPLERKLGPVEIRENETFDQATRVVVPLLSGKEEDLSTGKLKVVQDYVDFILEKQETAEGQQWRIIDSADPRYSEIKSTWLNLPRKKVPGSPTIILRRAIVMQVVSDDKVINQRILFWDK